MVQDFMKLPMSELKKIASGKTKLAYHDEEWLEKFEGSPLYDEALALEEACLSLDIEQKQRDIARQAERAEDSDLWKQRDAISLKKRILELELTKSRLGAGHSGTKEDESEEEEYETAVASPAVEARTKEAGLITRAGKAPSDIMAEREAQGRGHGGSVGASAGALLGALEGLRRSGMHGLPASLGYAAGGAALGGLGGGLTGSALGGHIGRNIAAADLEAARSGEASLEEADELDAAFDQYRKATSHERDVAARGAAYGVPVGALAGASLSHALGGRPGVGALLGGGAGSVMGTLAGGAIGRRGDNAAARELADKRLTKAMEHLDREPQKLAGISQETVEQMRKEAFGAAMMAGLKGLGQGAATMGKAVQSGFARKGMAGALSNAKRLGGAQLGQAAKWVGQNPGAAAGLAGAGLAGAAGAGYLAGRD
jgi:hypothetical protein